jgi:hypothetical protein
MMGRWRSGAPLALCPLHDDPKLGADPLRNNNFLFREDDPDGFKTPSGSHIRRSNPRDSRSTTGFSSAPGKTKTPSSGRTQAKARSLFPAGRCANASRGSPTSSSLAAANTASCRA